MFEDGLFGVLSFGLLFVLVIFKGCLDILDHLVPLLCWVMFGFLIGFAFLRGGFGVAFFALNEDRAAKIISLGLVIGGARCYCGDSSSWFLQAGFSS